MSEPEKRFIIGDPVRFWDEERRAWRTGTVRGVYDRGPRPPYYGIDGGGSTLFSYRLVRDAAEPEPEGPPDL